MNDIKNLTDVYLRLYKKIDRVQCKLTNSTESFILESVANAKSKADLNNIIYF